MKHDLALAPFSLARSIKFFFFFGCEVFEPTSTYILGAVIKSVNTGVVIGDKLDNQIFGLSQLESWKIKIHQLLSLKCSRNLFSFTTYATACADGL